MFLIRRIGLYWTVNCSYFFVDYLVTLELMFANGLTLDDII